MIYYNYNSDFPLSVPLYDNGAVLTDLSTVDSWSIEINSGNNTSLYVRSTGGTISHSQAISNVVVATNSVTFTIDTAETLGPGALMCKETVRFIDDNQADGYRQSVHTFHTGIMLVDWDTSGESSAPSSSGTSMGTLTVTTNGVNPQYYSGNTTTMDIKAWNNGTHPTTLGGYGLSQSVVSAAVLIDGVTIKRDASGRLYVVTTGGGGTSVAIDSYPTSGSTNAVSSGGVYLALNDKADISHTHAIADVTGLQSTLSGFQTSLSGFQTSLNGKANTSHTHAIADVIDLQSTLDGKASVNHTHDSRYLRKDQDDSNDDYTLSVGILQSDYVVSSGYGHRNGSGVAMIYNENGTGDEHAWVRVRDFGTTLIGMTHYAGNAIGPLTATESGTMQFEQAAAVTLYDMDGGNLKFKATPIGSQSSRWTFSNIRCYARLTITTNGITLPGVGYIELEQDESGYWQVSGSGDTIVIDIKVTCNYKFTYSSGQTGGTAAIHIAGTETDGKSDGQTILNENGDANSELSAKKLCIMQGSNGLRITATGIQTTSDGGTTWNDVTL